MDYSTQHFGPFDDRGHRGYHGRANHCGYDRGIHHCIAPTTTTTAAPPAWAAVAPGKFSVGVATLVIDDPAGVRPLSVDVWFPLSDKADKATLSPEQYTLLPGVYYQSPTALAAKVDQISSETFPLVVYSHGSGGLR